MTQIRLVESCGACPEQYDAFVGEERVGYLRLRHGYFSVECPGPGGDEVYRGHPDGDGCFTSRERSMYLLSAKYAIRRWMARRQDA